MLFKTKRFEVPSQNDIQNMLTFHQQQLDRLNKLNNYYLGKQDIFNRIAPIQDNANIKSMTNFCKLITDTLTAYLVSKPVEYKADDKTLEIIDKYNKINDARDEDYELCKLASIFGNAYEIVFFDERGELRYEECSPLDTMMLYDKDSMDNKAFAGMRYTCATDQVTKQTIYMLQIYTEKHVFNYKLKNDFTIVEREENEHFFKSLPIYELVNNAERQGDFEQIISLQDAYNLASCDWSNNIQNVVNSLLVFTNYNMQQDNETLAFMRKMKQMGCISIDSDGDVKYISSNLETTSVKELLNLLKNDIHKISCCPDMSDDKFGANASGVAMKYKLYNTEQVAGAKERKFYKLLQNRLRLISESPKTSQFDWLNVDIIFKRNIPQNDVEMIESLTKLYGIISNESLYGMFKFLGIENTQDEMKRVEAENKIINDYNLGE